MILDEFWHCEAASDTPSQPTRRDQGSREQHSTAFKAAGIDSLCSDDDVRAEAAKVEAKFVSQVDTRTEVVVRFDFMSDQDTRVSN